MVAHGWLTLGLLATGHLHDAVDAAEETARLAGHGVSSLGALGHTYAVAGRTAQARQVLDDLLDLSDTRYVSQYDLALIYLGLGDPETAMEWLERGFSWRDHQLAFLKVDPRVDVLRKRRDFGGLLERMRY